MADVMSHGGDGAGILPHQPPRRFRCVLRFRFTMPPYYPSWTEVPEEQRARLRSIIEVHNHLKAHGPSCPYDELSAEDWQKCIDFFTSLTFVERSTKNKANWGKAKYLSLEESKSFPVTHYDEVQRDPKTQQWSSIIESFWTFHAFGDDDWVNPQAAGD
ncbi:hypothetical protein Adt_32075 [Abeliophyllum distichum]|uniref:Uncharacterized protein n=1 Tax=Abeliophyllum distichum TaxID=126358 RepID=A0ABD1RGY5_9LAMI